MNRTEAEALVETKVEDPAKVKLRTLVEKFIAEDRREPVNDGYAPVLPGDIEALENILIGLISLRYAPDSDGDRPIAWTLDDRTRVESPGYLDAIPKPLPGTTLAQMEGRVKIATGNHSATGQVLERVTREALRFRDTVMLGLEMKIAKLRDVVSEIDPAVVEAARARLVEKKP